MKASRANAPVAQLRHNRFERLAVFGEDQKFAGKLGQNFAYGHQFTANRDRLGQRQEALQFRTRAFAVGSILYHFAQGGR